MIAAWAPLVLLLVGAQAIASDCAEPDLDPRRVQQRLDEARRALDGTNVTGARVVLAKLGSSLPCLPTVVERRSFGQFARLMSEASFYRQDEEAALRWGHAARLADPSARWTELRSDHPLRQRLDAADAPPLGVRHGYGLAAPPGGAVYLNGELTFLPEARAELPYLVQLVDDRAQVVAAYWQDGAAFPDQVLTDVAGPYPEPAWLTVSAPQARVRPERDRSGRRFPVAPVLLGGALAATSVASYALASQAHASLPEQTSAQGLTRARTTANAFVLVSGIAAAGAVGVGVGGVLLSPTGASFSGRF